jgi:hypothetical protein
LKKSFEIKILEFKNLLNNLNPGTKINNFKNEKNLEKIINILNCSNEKSVMKTIFVNLNEALCYLSNINDTHEESMIIDFWFQLLVPFIDTILYINKKNNQNSEEMNWNSYMDDENEVICDDEVWMNERKELILKYVEIIVIEFSKEYDILLIINNILSFYENEKFLYFYDFLGFLNDIRNVQINLILFSNSMIQKNINSQNLILYNSKNISFE